MTEPDEHSPLQRYGRLYLAIKILVGGLAIWLALHFLGVL